MKIRDTMKNDRTLKIMLIAFALGISWLFSLAIGYNLHMLFSGRLGQTSISPNVILTAFFTASDVRSITLLIFSLFLLGVIYLLIISHLGNFKNKLRKITPDISTPYPSGRGEYGTAEWLDKSEFGKHFGTVTLSPENPLISTLMKCGADDLSSELGGKNLAPCAISDIETVIFQDGG
ncbi:MAG: hypothetical protein RR263_05185, partial [Oscillospiraceae bacterium]